LLLSIPFHNFDFAPAKNFIKKKPPRRRRPKRSAAVSRRPAAARTNIEMPVIFIARANFTRSGTLLLVAQASGLSFPASRRKPFATTIIFPTTANPQAASPREIWWDACSTQKHPGGGGVRPVQRIGALEFTLQRGSNNPATRD
jgi:hypothetical protein